MAAAAGRRPRPGVDKLYLAKNLLLSMVARREKPGPGPGRLPLRSRADSGIPEKVTDLGSAGVPLAVPKAPTPSSASGPGF